MLIHTLKYPVKVGGTEYKQISFRRPKVKDTKLLADAAPGSESITANNNFLAQLSEVPPAVFDELDIMDAAAIQKIIDSFTQGIEK